MALLSVGLVGSGGGGGVADGELRKVSKSRHDEVISSAVKQKSMRMMSTNGHCRVFTGVVEFFVTVDLCA